MNLHVGPDGALYIVDMYRAIIEDYSAIPRYLQQQYIDSLIAGGNLGRIWRVSYDDNPDRCSLSLRDATLPTLVRTLEHPNGLWRETAQRLLVERGDRSAQGDLQTLATRGKSPQSRLHALYVLDGLASLTPEVVEVALNDSHFAVRMHATQLAERWIDQHDALRQQVFSLANDPEPRVRLQLAFSLGESRCAEATDVLYRLAVQHGEDRWMQAAILSSSSDIAADLIEKILRAKDRASRSDMLLRGLAAVVGARARQAEVTTVLAAVAARSDDEPAPGQNHVLQGLLEGLPQKSTARFASGAGLEAVGRLLAAKDAELKNSAFQLAKRLRFDGTAEMSAVLDEGLALFAGLNVIPKRSFLTEYSCRIRPDRYPRLMRHWFDAMSGLGLEHGSSFDLDFHTIPFHGEDALLEKHYVSKRSRRQKGILAFLAQDGQKRFFCYA
ncbi:MAG: hypothetical protein JJ992_12100, partial [Planctomycetes bacterium]|nr:hypothetical protein [Planctomycetota bacterium]